MGKVGTTSWLTTAVKKVFRSPTKSSPKKNCKTREESITQEDEEDTKKTEKRRWIVFRKITNNHNQQEEGSYEKKIIMESISMEEQKRAIAAAKAAVATAHAAVRFHQEIIPPYLAREYYAALIIQTAFRGYLARRALRALKGIVKLQALVRGTNIRKQAKATLKCMQTLIRVQTQLRHQSSFSRPPAPLSQGSIRKSMYAETNNLWDKYKHIHQRKSVSGNDEEYIEDESKIMQSYTIEDIEAMVQTKKQASLHREQALAYALSQQQIRRIDRKKCSRDEMVEQDKDTEWLSQWLDSKQYNNYNNTIDDAIKNVDMESLQQPPLRTPASHLHRSRHHQDPQPNRRQSLHTPRPGLNNTRPLCPVQVQSASPHYTRTQSAATTPISLRASRSNQSSTTPNYMAATESAKARARTQSTPRQRHSTSDRERGGSSSVKKRLSFPIPDEDQYHGRIYDTDEYSCCLSQNLTSPSFRSLQQGLYYYYYASSNTNNIIATGEVSPASTSHLRNTTWLG